MRHGGNAGRDCLEFGEDEHAHHPFGELDHRDREADRGAGRGRTSGLHGAAASAGDTADVAACQPRAAATAPADSATPASR